MTLNLSKFVNTINHSYLANYQTVLKGGFSEPFYRPAKNKQVAMIQFTQDYYRSALHELAHWCVAGIERRQQEDYGYWYAPDGRTQEQQQLFYQGEIKPQAIEWALSLVCDIDFEVSVDNLNNSTVEGANEFQVAVKAQLIQYIQQHFSTRTEILLTLIYQKNFSDLNKSLYTFLNQQII